MLEMSMHLRATPGISQGDATFSVALKPRGGVQPVIHKGADHKCHRLRTGDTAPEVRGHTLQTAWSFPPPGIPLRRQAGRAGTRRHGIRHPFPALMKHATPPLQRQTCDIGGDVNATFGLLDGLQICRVEELNNPCGEWE